MLNLIRGISQDVKGQRDELNSIQNELSSIKWTVRNELGSLKEEIKELKKAFSDVDDLKNQFLNNIGNLRELSLQKESSPPFGPPDLPYVSSKAASFIYS